MTTETSKPIVIAPVKRLMTQKSQHREPVAGKTIYLHALAAIRAITRKDDSQ